MNETQQTATIDVAVDLDEIFNLIYAESDWISAHNGSYYRLSPDNAPMLRLRVGEGYAQLQPRLQPYLLWANYNPNIEQRNLTLTLQFEHPQPSSLTSTIHQLVVQLLAYYALMRFYDGRTDLYATAWRRCNAQLMLMFARDANRGCALP
ncbi:MAG: hypothetical protein PUG64_04355 [Bacteroidales bacterium]|nr:hypothetical protein [Bacteroidales bacterium]MDY3913154.1 hypothetical protein [Sodaliphilus sp.]